jgi:hypothetical protein
MNGVAMKRRTTTASERVLGSIGLFAIGALAVAVDRIESDARFSRSSLGGLAAQATIAAIRFGGRIVDRVCRRPDSRIGLVVRRESGVK